MVHAITHAASKRQRTSGLYGAAAVPDSPAIGGVIYSLVSGIDSQMSPSRSQRMTS